jgi:hypothetical protein
MSKQIRIRLFITLCVLVFAACTSLAPSETASASPVRDQIGVEAEPPPASGENPAGPPPDKPAPGGPEQGEVSDASSSEEGGSGLTYPVVDTGQDTCYDDSQAIPCPAEGEAFYGQDAQFPGNASSYTNNHNGTITDNVTGLMWSQSPDLNGDGAIDVGDKLTYAEALAGAETFTLGGYDDWRLPTIKELYSLIDFRGVDPSGPAASDLVPFIDTTAFEFGYGDTGAGERIIDAQFASSTLYGSTTMGGGETMFGVNFADGRIKGYPTTRKTYYVLYVRGNPAYGENDFVDNGDPSTGSGQVGTITDNATGLMWAQDDSGVGLTWEDALAWVEQKNAEGYLGYSDWRLPDAKELQSIVDYTRAPDTTGSAAIDPLFNVTAITNEAGQTDYPFYWSSTTHTSQRNGRNAAYVAFGRAMGYWQGTWTDVHGAGTQRSDPKSGDPAGWAEGNGPQGDAVRIENYVRLVRGGAVDATPAGNPDIEMPSVVRDGELSPEKPRGSSDPQTGPGEGQPQPPEEAFEACEGLTEGAACTVQAPRRQVEGTCRPIHQDLVCVPAGGPPPKPGPAP